VPITFLQHAVDFCRCSGSHNDTDSARQAAPALPAYHEPQLRLYGLLQLYLQLLNPGVRRANGADRILVDRLDQRLVLLPRLGDLGAGKPQHQSTEMDQHLVERSVDLCDFIHRTTLLPPEINGSLSATFRFRQGYG
jgi:hypothetical protein